MAPTPINYQDLAAKYGFAYATLMSNPELKALFNLAVKGTKAEPGPWQPDLFLARLEGTKWWKTTSDTARQWQILQGADPKTAAQRATARMQTIRDAAANIGVVLTAQQLKDITNDSIMFGWTDQQVQKSIGADWKYNPATLAGQAQTTLSALRKTASDYLVPLSDQAIQSWVQPIIEGESTPDKFIAYAQNQAKTFFPAWASEIDAGKTVQDLADPYKQAAGQLLERDPATIDLTDPKFRKAIDQVDPKTGQHSVMSLADWQNTLRQDSAYGYDQTTGARAQAADLATKIAAAFGAG